MVNKQIKLKLLGVSLRMYKMLLATMVFIIGLIVTWFTSYAQFISVWAKQNTFLLTCLLAIPGTLCFVYGIRLTFDFFNNGWGPRFYVFSLSFLVYPFLFSYFLNEPFLTLKNILCTILAFAIIVIQIQMK